ncbi:uncharacterized protein LOC119682377 [Teleopsis dalmanni]|uniref:uncharacterized protein LOC119682377 n=1 Tax=Teleopsis dalmanni TaxID=139649 RepID=UPI0018CD4B8C|nr:uncharacterized protein LOC119682377 [Teleopsis dalmanni]
MSSSKNVDVNTESRDDAVVSTVPEWIKPELFVDLLKNTIPGYKDIGSFKVASAVPPGENYATIILRISIEVVLEDDKTVNKSFIMKTLRKSELIKQQVGNVEFFVESEMYKNILPEFEKLYADIGLQVKFGIRAYSLPIKIDHVLLDDLCQQGFKNVNRLLGLDLAHTENVLKKLAQFHAASAVRVATKGMFPAPVMTGIFKSDYREFIEQMTGGMCRSFLANIQCYDGHEAFIKQVQDLQPSLVTKYFALANYVPEDFNVLNHGDSWANNIMFQHDEDGNINDTCFVDYQIPKYGTPAQDLLYFLMSSPNYDIKIRKFDYFIRYYHDHLSENLKLLNYSKKIPTLRELHIDIHKYGIWAFITSIGTLAACLFEPNKDANLENLMSITEEGIALKRKMYSQESYRKNIEIIMPWLLNRGVLE